MRTSEETQHLGRAKNAMLTFLERRLSVPKIYFDADWDGRRVDLLAIDRDGIGDVHVVLVISRRFFQDGLLDVLNESQIMEERATFLASLPAQFKYLAVADAIPPGPFVRQYPVHLQAFEKHSIASDGLGRMGLVRVEIPAEEDVRTEVIVKAERFRARVATLANEYIHHHEADWEVRA